MTRHRRHTLFSCAALVGVASLAACGQTSFSGSAAKPARLVEKPRAEPAIVAGKESGTRDDAQEGKVDPVVEPDPLGGEAQSAPVSEPSTGVMSPVPPPAVAPPPGTQTLLACKVDLAARFGGFAVKGGAGVAVDDVFPEYPTKALPTFPEGSKVSYSSGRFTAGTGVVAAFDQAFMVTIPGVPECVASLSIKVLPDDSFVVAQQLERGLKGGLYRLPAGTPNLPDFSTLKPVGDVFAESVNVPNRSFLDGFPGVAGFFEWFAIDFQGLLLIENPGEYTFRIESDDGSILYLDGGLVINNDGQHGVQSRDSAVISLARGAHPLRLSYFQGPADKIALRFFYKGPGMSGFEIVPQSMLRVVR
jgi:hypothetical protein